MNKFPDDVFQIFLEYNDQPEIMGLLTWIDEDNDYRVKKYIYYISNELKRREWDKEIEKRKKNVCHKKKNVCLEKRKKNKGQINKWTYGGVLNGSVIFEDVLTTNSKIIGNLVGGIGLDKFFNQDLTGRSK